MVMLGGGNVQVKSTEEEKKIFGREDEVLYALCGIYPVCQGFGFCPH